MPKIKRFFGVKNIYGEKFIDISKVVFWSIQDNVLCLTLEGGYTRSEDKGDAEYIFDLKREDGAELLLEELRSISTNLWEQKQ